jgi:hypothetical protein
VMSTSSSSLRASSSLKLVSLKSRSS